MEHYDIEGTAGMPITLPIARGPATGYSWMLALPAGVTQTDDGPTTPPPASERAGSGTKAALQVIAPAGEHVITARLARGPQDDAIREVRMHLRVDP